MQCHGSQCMWRTSGSVVRRLPNACWNASSRDFESVCVAFGASGARADEVLPMRWSSVADLRLRFGRPGGATRACRAGETLLTFAALVTWWSSGSTCESHGPRVRLRRARSRSERHIREAAEASHIRAVSCALACWELSVCSRPGSQRDLGSCSLVIARPATSRHTSARARG